MDHPTTTRRGDGRPGLALLGGAFNPPHRTHRRLCAAALQQLPIDEVRVLPAGDHPHKRGDAVVAAAHRLAMARLCFADVPGVVVDDREVQRGGVSFTVDTLEALHQEQPGRQLWFLIGADNLALLPSWHRHHRILELAHVATFPRLGAATDASTLADLDLTTAERTALLAHRLQLTPDATSASSIRARLRRGERDLAELLPAVERYIVAHHLYDT